MSKGKKTIEVEEDVIIHDDKETEDLIKSILLEGFMYGIDKRTARPIMDYLKDKNEEEAKEFLFQVILKMEGNFKSGIVFSDLSDPVSITVAQITANLQEE